MLEGLLRGAAIVATGIVVLSFALFAVDEAQTASDRTVQQIQGHEAASTPAPSATEERARERVHGPAREAIDDANDVLVSPFAALAPRDQGTWARRGIPAVAAVLVLGFGLAFLARFAKGRP
ncbi:MAG: hypothetical protein QOH46_2336 [Solirubrobacteraceae bacterium]|nr:hypothetical protein [Solirubrobacteraceae bacterium]